MQLRSCQQRNFDFCCFILQSGAKFREKDFRRRYDWHNVSIPIRSVQKKWIFSIKCQHCAINWLDYNIFHFAGTLTRHLLTWWRQGISLFNVKTLETQRISGVLLHAQWNNLCKTWTTSIVNLPRLFPTVPFNRQHFIAWTSSVVSIYNRTRTLETSNYIDRCHKCVCKTCFCGKDR